MFNKGTSPKSPKHHDFQAEAKDVEVSTSMYAASGGVEVSAWDLNDWKVMVKVKKSDTQLPRFQKPLTRFFGSKYMFYFYHDPWGNGIQFDDCAHIFQNELVGST